jgi:hypothetical protein
VQPRRVQSPILQFIEGLLKKFRCSGGQCLSGRLILRHVQTNPPIVRFGNQEATQGPVFRIRVTKHRATHDTKPTTEVALDNPRPP